MVDYHFSISLGIIYLLIIHRTSHPIKTIIIENIISGLAIGSPPTGRGLFNIVKYQLEIGVAKGV
jgi:hypothetical protein